jgi:arginase
MSRSLLHQRPIRILGVPMDLGQQRRGVDMGPSALRYAGFYERLVRLGCQVEDAGNVLVPVREQRDVQAQQWTEGAGGGLRHLPAVVAACRSIYEVSQSCCGTPEIPIFLGGDHSIAIGTVSGTACAGPLGLIWIDAHGDFNTPETSPSGNIHGMPVAALIGRGHPELVDLGHSGPKLRPQEIAMIGIRDLDPAERDALTETGIHVYTMRDIDELGMATVARRALSHLNHLSRIHVSPGHGRHRPRHCAWRRHAGAWRPLLSRGAPVDGDSGGVGQDRLHRRGGDQPDPGRWQPHGRAGGGTGGVTARPADFVRDLLLTVDTDDTDQRVRTPEPQIRVICEHDAGC